MKEIHTKEAHKALVVINNVRIQVIEKGTRQGNALI
jgi:hypothetical protein